MTKPFLLRLLILADTRDGMDGMDGTAVRVRCRREIWGVERGDLQAAFEGRPFKWETFFAATHSHSRVVLKKATPNRVAEDHGSERQKKEGRVCSGVFDLLPACLSCLIHQAFLPSTH